MRTRIAIFAVAVIAAMVAAAPGLAWDDTLTLDSIVCDTQTGQNVVTVRYTNHEDAGHQVYVPGHLVLYPFHYVPGHWELVDDNNDVDIVKVNGDDLDPVVTAEDGGGSALVTVKFAGVDTGQKWVTLTIGWNRYAGNYHAYDGPDSGHSPDFDTIKIKVTLEGCELVPDEPSVVLTPPRVDTTGYCVQTLNRGWTYVEAATGAFDTGAEWRALYDAAAVVFVAGHELKLAAEGDAGLIVAPIVDGIGGTCDQPWVSNDTPPAVKTK